MSRSKWSKFLDKYFVYVLGITVSILIAIPIQVYFYYQDIEWPRKKYEERDIHHPIISLIYKMDHDEKVPYARFEFDNMTPVKLYRVNYEDLQDGDSIVKRKNDMHMLVYRVDTLVYDSRDYGSEDW